MPDNSFASWLAREMAVRRLNQSQLAAFLGVKHSAVSNWVNKGGHPNTATCQALARVLKLPLEEVLRAAGHLPPLDPGELAEEDAAYISADLTPAVAIARQLIAAGGAEALEEWEDIGESVLRAYQKRQARD